MTLPCERFRAVMSARKFLYALLDPKQTPRTPRAVRQEARRVLRHFPFQHEMEQAAQQAPDVFAAKSTFLCHEGQQKMEESSNELCRKYTPSDQDIIIGEYRLVCTCSVCPEQYDVFVNNTDTLHGYLRLRHGVFRADCPDVGGETVYETETAGDGCFENDERMPQLQNAINAIREYWVNLKKEYGNESKE